MSEKQSDNSSNLPQSNGESQQAEDVSRRAEIIHQDGTREQVEFKAQRFWAGALPRPEDFAKYAEVVSDAPERILRMAEKEQDHRIHLENQIVPADNKAGARGQWLGAVISLAALILAVLANWLDAPWQVSVALVGVPVLSVARSLVTAIKSSSG
ncbi:DUF2335 domain-containing protein [Phaeobacter inhibens]|uniref:DUF2335 domain-containing protein n=1 Tax=Phaeobacter inhibens TaxID=221822 RepID=UPI000C9A2D22|nr:DUF2335 domain-containing protein [Phaeobacter inhibens]